MADPERNLDPGPFGWVARLTRWASYDRTPRGMMGPLPPPPVRGKDATSDDLYSLGDGWLAGTVGASLSSFFSEPRTRRELYLLFEKMDLTDTAGAVLDIYADDATQPDPETGLVCWVECENPEMQEQADLLQERLNLEDDLSAIARDVAKYGDLFERAVYRPGLAGGLRRLIPVPPTEMTRHEDKDGKLVGYRQAAKKFRDGNADMSFPWDYVHFRLRGKDRRYPYGTSILHTGIRPWKQCCAQGSLIWTGKYMVPIETVRCGDTVLCYDHETHDIRRTCVVAAGKTGVRPVVKIRSRHAEIVVTADHPILVLQADGVVQYKNAGDLRLAASGIPADRLVTLFGVGENGVLYDEIRSREDAGVVAVYDLTVEDPVHNFVAGGVVVHNCIILEDWAMGYTVNKHPDRNMIIIDTGTASETEQAEIGRRFKQKLKRHMLLDPGGQSGRFINYRADPITPMEDILLAIRSGSNTRVERLFGSANGADMLPLESAYERFYAAVRVPRAFFSSGKMQSGEQPINMKARLSNQDIRYAHAVRRLQRSVRAGLTYAHQLNFMVLMGLEAEDARYDFAQPKHGFNVLMGPISYLEEQEQLEVAQLRQQVALAVYEMGVQNPAVRIAELTAYILQEILKAPDKVIQAVLRSQEEVEEREMAQMQAEMGAEAPPPGSSSARSKEDHKRAAAGAPAPRQRKESLIPNPSKKDGHPDSAPTRAMRRMLSEAIFTNRDLRRAVQTGLLLWKEGEEPSLARAITMLPDGDVSDSLTERDLETMAQESIGETQRAGA